MGAGGAAKISLTTLEGRVSSLFSPSSGVDCTMMMGAGGGVNSA